MLLFVRQDQQDLLDNEWRPAAVQHSVANTNLLEARPFKILHDPRKTAKDLSARDMCLCCNRVRVRVSMVNLALS